MNPLIKQAVIDAALASDLHKANAEYFGIWREDQEDCFPPDAITDGTDVGVLERPPVPFVSYFAFSMLPPEPAPTHLPWLSRIARVTASSSTRSASENHASFLRTWSRNSASF